MKKEDLLLKIEYLKKKLKKLKKSNDKLYEVKGKDFDYEYIILRAIERDCEEIIEIATKINQEILSLNNEIAMTYRESFEKLNELNLFNSKDDKKLLEKLSNSTGFRNRLAHDYMNLDDEITIKTSKQIVEIFPRYLIKIIEYLDKLK